MAVTAGPLVQRRAGVAYRSILVPLVEEAGWEGAMETACRLAADSRATVTALVVVEVPAELPLDAHMLAEHAAARERLARAEAIGDAYGVTVARTTTQARATGEGIVEAAERTGSELIVLRAHRRTPGRTNGRRPVFGMTEQTVLQHAPCRVLLSLAPAQ
jgi:nucleotide-binding universal stress UspA family protein